MQTKFKVFWPWLVASVIIHSLVIASLWQAPPQYIAAVQSAYVMVEILSSKPEQPASVHRMKVKTTPVHLRHRPVKSSTVKKPAPEQLHIHTSTPVFPPPVVAGIQTGKLSQPVQTMALSAPVPAASNPGVLRQVQREDRRGNHNAVRKHLESFKYYPASARRRGIEGNVDVSFKLVHGGAAEQVKVLKGSGYTVLDHAAISTVARAQPFPVENGLFRFRLRFRRL